MKLTIIILILGLVLIAGCTTKDQDCTPVDNIVYINTTITEYINITNIEIQYINSTSECKSDDESYVNRLIMDAGRCYEELRYLNRTNLSNINYDLNISLGRCEDKIEDMKELLGNQ